jgi:ankyrin repeat protein
MVAVYSNSGPKSGTSPTNVHRTRRSSSLPHLTNVTAAVAVQALLNAGASPDELDKAQRSVFHWAAQSSNYHSLNAIFATRPVAPSLLDAQVLQ